MANQLAERRSASSSFKNAEEVRVVRDVVQLLLRDATLGPPEIGVISPYSAQVKVGRRSCRFSARSAHCVRC